MPNGGGSNRANAGRDAWSAEGIDPAEQHGLRPAARLGAAPAPGVPKSPPGREAPQVAAYFGQVSVSLSTMITLLPLNVVWPGA